MVQMLFDTSVGLVHSMPQERNVVHAVGRLLKAFAKSSTILSATSTALNTSSCVVSARQLLHSPSASVMVSLLVGQPTDRYGSLSRLEMGGLTVLFEVSTRLQAVRLVV
jgi:hypothetical protein